MRFIDRYSRSHHGFGPWALWLVIPLLTLIVPVLTQVTGIRRRGPNDDGTALSDLDWPMMAAVWLILLAFIYLVYIPFIAPARQRRRNQRNQQN